MTQYSSLVSHKICVIFITKWHWSASTELWWWWKSQSVSSTDTITNGNDTWLFVSHMVQMPVMLQ